MRSMPQALLWETISRGRWTLPGVFLLAIMLPLLVYGALSGLTIDPKAQEFVALQFAFVPIVMFQLAIGVAMAQGPLSRLYTFPISANSIVAWHMFSGALILALETAASSWLFSTLFHVNWPILGPALFAVAAWSALQVLMSVSSQQSLPAFCFAGAPAVLLCLWLQTRYGGWFSPPKHYWTELTPTEVATLLGAFGVCYLMTAYSVSFARCGERMPTLGIWKWLAKQWDNFTLARTAPPSFHSAAAAQFWYEWQVKGIALPLITMLMLLCAVTGGLGAWYMQKSSLSSFYEVVLFLGGFVSVLACAAGLFFGLEIDAKPVGQRETQLGDSISEAQFPSGIGSFLSSRPFSSKGFSYAILRTAAQSSLLAWLIWFAVFAGCLLTMWSTKQFPSAFMPRGTGLLYIPMTILGPWIALANLGTIGLSGRGAKILFGLVSSFVGYCIWMGVVNHFTNAAVTAQIHSFCITIVFVLIFAATLWTYAQARRQQLVTLKTLLVASLAGCALVIAAILLLPADVHFIVYPSILAFASSVVLPFASMPLAIAWNRHR